MKTTSKQFKYFKSRCHHWAKELGLVGWRLYIKHAELDDAYASYDANYDGKVVTIKFTKNLSLGNPVLDDDQIDRTAYHELFHVKLFELEVTIKYRYDYLHESVEHDIINTIEQLVFNGHRYK